LWENYFNGGLIERYTKDKIFSHEMLETIGTTTCRTFSINIIFAKL